MASSEAVLVSRPLTRAAVFSASSSVFFVRSFRRFRSSFACCFCAFDAIGFLHFCQAPFECWTTQQPIRVLLDLCQPLSRNCHISAILRMLYQFLQICKQHRHQDRFRVRATDDEWRSAAGTRFDCLCNRARDVRTLTVFAFHPPWSSIYVRHFAGSTRLSKSAPHLLTVQPAQLDCDHALEACTLRATATTETRRAFGIDGGHALRLDRSGAIFPAPPSRAVRWRPLTPAVARPAFPRHHQAFQGAPWTPPARPTGGAWGRRRRWARASRQSQLKAL